MDFQLICIVFVFGLLFVLEKIDDKEKSGKEKFTVSRPGYTNTSPFLDLRNEKVSSAVNFAKKDREFGNFGAFGSYPANPLCPSCKLDSNVVTNPYLHINDVGDENGALFGKINLKCRDITGKNYNDLNKPFLVAGRSAGRTRQCRRLL